MVRMLLVSTYENNSRSFIKPQGGQVFIKKYLELNNDIEVELIDPQMDSLDTVYSRFQEMWNFIGFYCTYPTILNTSKLIIEAYKYNPDAVFILGGPGVAYHDVLTICYADIVIYGEGEKIISDIAKIVTTKDDLVNKEEQIRAIKGNFIVNIRGDERVYRGVNALGCENICTNEDLNAIIPLAEWEIGLHDKYRVWTAMMLQHTYGFPVFISRGCSSLGCNFCSSYEWFRSKKGVRYCGEEVAYNLIRDILQSMPETKEILFEDDNLLSNRQWAMNFFGLIENGIVKGEVKRDVKYILKTRVDLIDEEIIEKLLKLGTIQINLGVESNAEDVLYELNKTKNARGYLKLVDKLFDYHKKYNLHFHCYMIFFTPNSKMSDLLASIDLVIRFLQAGIEISCYDSLLVFPGAYFDKMWKDDPETVNWVETINPLYYCKVYSENEKKSRNIKRIAKLPYDFLIADEEVRRIYDKSIKIFKWLYVYYWNRFNWRANTSFRIALVKVLSYLVVINVTTTDEDVRERTGKHIDSLAQLIEDIVGVVNEDMSCRDHVKYFDSRKGA